MADLDAPDPVSPDRPSGPEDQGSGPLVIGLIGGVASGKSTVAEALREIGCSVADADRICHDALREAAVRDAVVAVFGPAVLGPNGEVDRARLRPVFDDPEALARLEGILHPIAIERTRQAIREARRDRRPGVIVDAPLLLESGLDRLCDVLVLVDVTEASRRARARGRGMGESDWARRERHQLPVDEKRRRAHHTLDADAPESEVRRRVRELWNRLTGPK